MTVADWIVERVPQSPVDLHQRLLAMIGQGARRPADETMSVCLDAASRELRALLAAHRFEREAALDLLTIDALVTLAFEHAAEHADANVRREAAQAIRDLGQLVSAA